MKIKILILSVISTVTLVNVGVLPTPYSMNRVEASSAQTAKQFKTYRSPKVFSIQYPSGWNVNKTHNKYVAITNYKPRVGGGTNFIKTEITFAQGSMEKTFNKGISNNTEHNAIITKREKLTIGGRQALRFWVTDNSGFDFPNIIITYIRYNNNQTAIVSSYYTSSNTSAVGTIQRIHQSFKVIK